MSPEYVTVTGWAPAARDEVVHCATPTESGSEVHSGMGVPLSLKFTVPVGVPALPVSVVVKVTAWPDVDGLRVDAIKMPAKAAVTFCVNVLEVPAR
jgi:hypothetical protein